MSKSAKSKAKAPKPTKLKQGKDQLPSMLSFRKKVEPVDALMYSLDDNGNTSPLSIVKKRGRGTASFNRNNQTNVMDVECSNPYDKEECNLPSEGTGIAVIKESVKVYSNIDPDCNNYEFYKLFLEKRDWYIKNAGFDRLAPKYCINIANGRWIWNNALGAMSIKIDTVITHSTRNGNTKYEFSFDAKKFDLNNFNVPDIYSNDIKRMSDLFCEVLSSGDRDTFLTIDMTATINYYEGFDGINTGKKMYPSQKMSDEMELYNVNGIAAMTEQKIGNALRHVDNTHGYERGTEIISVETEGQNTFKGAIKRPSKNKNDFFTLFKKFMFTDDFNTLNQDDLEHLDYVMAVLIRGGVFSEKGNPKPDPNEPDTNKPADKPDSDNGE